MTLLFFLFQMKTRAQKLLAPDSPEKKIDNNQQSQHELVESDKPVKFKMTEKQTENDDNPDEQQYQDKKVETEIITVESDESEKLQNLETEKSKGTQSAKESIDSDKSEESETTIINIKSQGLETEKNIRPQNAEKSDDSDKPETTDIDEKSQDNFNPDIESSDSSEISISLSVTFEKNRAKNIQTITSQQKSKKKTPSFDEWFEVYAKENNIDVTKESHEQRGGNESGLGISILQLDLQIEQTKLLRRFLNYYLIC